MITYILYLIIGSMMAWKLGGGLAIAWFCIVAVDIVVALFT